MTGSEAIEWCAARPGAVEEFPFGPDARVYKVGGKMFALFASGPEPATVNLKCDPRFAGVLREEHPETITPGYHMNKRHWNTLRFGAGLPGSLVQDLLDHSYALVVDQLPRRLRDELRAAGSAGR
jgi:predicted DNA-binding protein (MmcQ/YjbR family)